MADFVDPWLPAPDRGFPTAAARPAVPVAVYRVGAAGGAPPEALPNVVCVAVEIRAGDVPSTALFRYVFDGRDPTAPQSTEEALATGVTRSRLARLVEVGDRLAVRATRPDGGTEWLFHGEALTWTMRVDRGTDAVIIAAVGVERHGWDTPIGGAVWRAGDHPETVRDVVTGLTARFNPGGLPNASPSTGDSGAGRFAYPVQMDPDRAGTDANGNAYPRPFDLPMAVANIVYLGNDSPLIANPIRPDLDALLIGREPIDGVGFDPNDPATFTPKAIDASDAPLSGRPWPAAVMGLIRDYGFSCRWPVTSGANGNPSTAFEPFLLQGSAPKPVLLQPRGSRLDPRLSNVGAAELTRDLSSVVNRWVVNGAPDRWEVSFILAPAFPSQASDSANQAALDLYRTANLTADTQDKYRTFVADEDGSGHYAPASLVKIAGTATSLDPVLGAPTGDPAVPKYVARRRPPLGRLLSVDADGKPMAASLSVSTAYAGAAPGLWDGTGADAWQPVHGGWELLRDRVGVRLTCEDPNAWDVGKPGAAAAAMPFGAGVVHVVQAVGAPDADQAKAVKLRLTVVIEADHALSAVAARQDSSPLTGAVTRTVDAADRYALETVHAPGEWHHAGGATDLVTRDQSGPAAAEAVALRTASEAGVMEGEVMVPRFTAAYRVGDRLSSIEGRGLGLRTDTGGVGFAAVLPVVVAVRWELDGGQRTHLRLSDAGLDRRRYGLKPPKGRGKRGRASAGAGGDADD